MASKNLTTAAMAAVTVGAMTLVPAVGTFFLAPALAAVIGGVVAWQAARASGSAGQGTGAALVAGFGALIGTFIACTAFGLILGADPGFQEMAHLSEPHPEARLPYEWIAPLGAATGAFVGLLVGVGNLILSVVAGFLTGLVGASGAQRQSVN